MLTETLQSPIDQIEHVVFGREQAQADPIAHLFDYWNSIRNGTSLPAKNDLAPEQYRYQPIGQRHEGQGGTDHYRGVEMARNIKCIVKQDINLLYTHDDPGYATQESETDQGYEHAGKCRITPGSPAQPFEQAVIETLGPLGPFN